MNDDETDLKLKPPSFPFYVNNWLASATVEEMTLEEQGAYVRLLARAWQNIDEHGPWLPDDDIKLASLSRLGTKWEGVTAERMRSCWQSCNGRLVNGRLMDCWRNAMIFRERQSKAGKKGMSARYGKTYH